MADPTQPSKDPWGEVDTWLERSAPPPADKTPGNGFPKDPVEWAVNKGAEYLPESTPWWARLAGRALIPQNTPEAAVAAALMLTGGPIGLGARGLMSAGGRALAKTVVGAGAGAGAAALTGHDPMTHGALGALGAAGAELGGEATRALAQTRVVHRMMDAASERLGSVLRNTFSRVIPADASAPQILQRVISGDALKASQGAIEDLAGKNVRTSSFFTDPDVGRMVMAASAAGKDVTVASKQTGRVVPSFEKLWKEVPDARDALAKFLHPDDQIAYASEKRGAATAEVIGQWLSGGESNVGKVASALLDDKGRLSPEGLAAIYKRMGETGKDMETALGKPLYQALEQAIYHDWATGMSRITVGQGPGFRVGTHGPLRPGFGVDVSGVTLPEIPGWPSQAGAVAQLAPNAVRAILAPLAQKPLAMEHGGGRATTIDAVEEGN